MSEGLRRGLALALLVPMTGFALLALVHDLLVGPSASPGEDPVSGAEQVVTYGFWLGLPLIGWLLFGYRRYTLAASAVALPFVWAAAALVFMAVSTR